MKTLRDILALEDESEKIRLLKYRRTPEPDVQELLDMWLPEKHEINDKEKRPDSKMIVKEAYRDPKTGKEYPAEYRNDDANPTNRISIPLEQDITNIHTAWSVGKDPVVSCEPNDDGEKELLKVIKAVCRKNKMRYNNKRIVRSWLSETEVAEYWYKVQDTGFWARMMSSVKGVLGLSTKAVNKIKCQIWSPFRGDKLYPFFNDSGDYEALSREYKTKEPDGTETAHFMTVTSDKVYMWRMDRSWVKEKEFKHGFSKNPTVYSYRARPLCFNIQPIRERLERLLSNFADCIDRCFFPYLILDGDIQGTPQKVGKNRMIKLTNGGKVYYLNWDQASEAVRLELDGLWDKSYMLTNTPRLSMEALKGLGDVPSGKAFQFLFMGTNMAVDNHAEVIGEHLQRRYNFLATAIGDLNAGYFIPAQTIDMDVEIQPYTIDDLAERIKNALDACGESIASRRTGVMMAGLVENVDEEMQQIKENESKIEEIKKSEKK